MARVQAEQERKKGAQKHPQTSEGSLLQKFSNPIASNGGRSVSHCGYQFSCSNTGSPAGLLCSACDGPFLAANLGPQLRNMLSSEHGELQPEPEPEPESQPFSSSSSSVCCRALSVAHGSAVTGLCALAGLER